MKRLLPALALLAGCRGAAPPAPSGQEVLAASAAAVNAVADRLQPSLPYLQVQLEDGGTGESTALVLSEDGTVLLPFFLERDKIQRVRAWVGGREHPAEFLKADDRVHMSLLRIDRAAGPFVPAPLSDAPAPSRGTWLVSLTASGKESDFQLFASLGMVRGTTAEEFDQLLMAGGDSLAGTVLADLDGAVVAVYRGDEALAVRDLKRRLGPLMARPEATASSADSAKAKPWIGVILEPINEDYAEASGLPGEAVWFQQVFQGSPAERAGLKAGDLVVKVDGQGLGRSGQAALPRLFKLFSPEIGRSLRIGVLREGKPLEITCAFEKAPEPREFKADDLGLEVKEITEPFFHSVPGLYCRQGVFVDGVVGGTPAAAGSGTRGSLVRQGDVIVELDGKPTPTLEAFQAALDALRRAKPREVLLRLRRGVVGTYAALNLSLKEGGESP